LRVAGIHLDARGHGESDWSDTGDYHLVSFAGDRNDAFTAAIIDFVESKQ
jgi:pimeloyl-ACP methyl ester carboxylesterase